jgi:hypothetical protein
MDLRKARDGEESAGRAMANSRSQNSSFRRHVVTKRILSIWPIEMGS